MPVKSDTKRKGRGVPVRPHTQLAYEMLRYNTSYEVVVWCGSVKYVHAATTLAVYHGLSNTTPGTRSMA